MQPDGSVKNGRSDGKSASNPSELTRKIRDEAGRLGFFKTGVTRARPLPEGEHLDQWLAEGMHGEMGYMARQAPKRKDPSRVLSDARSIVVLAMNYHTGDSLTDEPLRGRISRYAWGDDYHVIIKERLAALYGFIRREESRAEGLYYVDTGPILEKVWGAQSALGWMGKHSNLITREQGSWFFIGILLLNIELEYDATEKDFCGTCFRCSAACPTGAIIAPYVVDARLCISYLTIEHRGPIPRELRSLIGNRIYGCDDCQEVCPWNRFAVPTTETSFHAREENWMPELASLVSISQQEFQERFRNSPIRRAKRDGFVRNVVVALGNSRHPDAVAALRFALHDESALVRAHAAWALGQIGTKECRALLEEAQDREFNGAVREEIERAIQDLNASERRGASGPGSVRQ